MVNVYSTSFATYDLASPINVTLPVYEERFWEQSIIRL